MTGTLFKDHKCDPPAAAELAEGESALGWLYACVCSRTFICNGMSRRQGEAAVLYWAFDLATHSHGFEGRA